MQFLNKNEAREQLVFKDFIKKKDGYFNLDWIKNTPPPQPDILYKHPQNPTAYELLEICSEDIASLKVLNEIPIYIRTEDTYEDKFKRKLDNNYISDYPTELICYTSGRVISPDDLIIQKINIIVGSCVPRFKRIWLLGDNLNLIFKNKLCISSPVIPSVVERS